jgi:CheY-like chemotaxis protein
MIRSFEKEHLGILSPRAALCGRVPIIAVSASLVEESLQEYVDTGFDAWILKPISFPRLGELMTAIVDFDVRKKCLYQPGDWEHGGWFHCDQKALEAVDATADAKNSPSGPPGHEESHDSTETVTAETAYN